MNPNTDELFAKMKKDQEARRKNAGEVAKVSLEALFQQYRAMAAQVVSLPKDTFRGMVTRLLAGWIETAASFQASSDYYRNKLVEIGAMFGDDAKRRDDGTLSDDVLVAKLPEVVRKYRVDQAVTSARETMAAMKRSIDLEIRLKEAQTLAQGFEYKLARQTQSFQSFAEEAISYRAPPKSDLYIAPTDIGVVELRAVLADVPLKTIINAIRARDRYVAKAADAVLATGSQEKRAAERKRLAEQETAGPSQNHCVDAAKYACAADRSKVIEVGDTVAPNYNTNPSWSEGVVTKIEEGRVTYNITAGLKNMLGRVTWDRYPSLRLVKKGS